MKSLNSFQPLRYLPAVITLLLLAVNYSIAQSTVPNPRVVIVSPTNGDTFAAPTDIQITANASDVGAFVHIIKFYEGTNQLAMFILDPLPNGSNGIVIPVSFTWTNVPAGSYSLTVVGEDTHGSSTTSAPVNIVVAGPIPVVSIIATDPIAVEGTNFHPYATAAAFANYYSGSNTATFLIRRIGDTNSDLTVYYDIGGTASNGVDYQKIADNVTIPAGKRFALVTIVPIEDIDPASRRFDTVILSLKQPPPPNPPPMTAVVPPLPYIIGIPAKAAAIILEDYDLPGPPTGPLPLCCFNVGLPGTNGTIYCLQVSTNLVDWTPLCTNMVVKGCIHFVDTDVCDLPGRYYRAILAAALPAY